jgi:hypothetical protein
LVFSKKGNGSAHFRSRPPISSIPPSTARKELRVVVAWHGWIDGEARSDRQTAWLGCSGDCFVSFFLLADTLKLTWKFFLQREPAENSRSRRDGTRVHTAAAVQTQSPKKKRKNTTPPLPLSSNPLASMTKPCSSLFCRTVRHNSRRFWNGWTHEKISTRSLHAHNCSP